MIRSGHKLLLKKGKFTGKCDLKVKHFNHQAGKNIYKYTIINVHETHDDLMDHLIVEFPSGD